MKPMKPILGSLFAYFNCKAFVYYYTISCNDINADLNLPF